MTEMLTAKEMQTILQVDRSTIYRMAEAGRLPAVKVGKQWRFPTEEVELWFNLQISPTAAGEPGAKTADRPVSGTGRTATLEALLPLDCVQPLQNMFADLLGVMLVVTDIAGNPITEPSWPCGLFRVVSQQPHALQRCIDSWHTLAVDLDLEPKFSRSHLGLLCGRAMIRVGTELQGMVVAGCIAPEAWPPAPEEVKAMAEQFDVTQDLLVPHLNEVHKLDTEQQERVLIYLQRIANVVAHIVHERKSLIGRLDAIADLTAF